MSEEKRKRTVDEAALTDAAWYEHRETRASDKDPYRHVRGWRAETTLGEALSCLTTGWRRPRRSGE